MHSCISCSLVASRMTRMFSLRADSCCCCLSFSSDSFSPVTSLAKTVKRGRKERASEEISLSQAAKCSDYSCWDMLAGEIMFYVVLDYIYVTADVLTTQISIFCLQDLDIRFMLFPPERSRTCANINSQI